MYLGISGVISFTASVWPSLPFARPARDEPRLGALCGAAIGFGSDPDRDLSVLSRQSQEWETIEFKAPCSENVTPLLKKKKKKKESEGLCFQRALKRNLLF